MSAPNWLRIASATLAMLHVFNAGMAAIHADPRVALLCAGLLMGLQTLVNETSLSTPPEFKK